MTKHSMLTLIVAYLCILLITFLMQRKLIYFPETYTWQHQPNLTGDHLQPWPSRENYRALIGRNIVADSKGTILLFHGNAGSARSRTHYLDALERLGYQVLLAEYPGYGPRPGQPSEQAMVEDALKTTELAAKTFKGPLYLWGESLGSGVVSGIVRSGRLNIHGITLITPFDSLANVAQKHYPFLLGKYLTRDKFNNVENLARFNGNLAVILAGNDEVIPNTLTRSLFNQVNTRKKLWQFPEAGHNNLPVAPDQSWWHEVMHFLSQKTRPEERVP